MKLADVNKIYEKYKSLRREDIQALQEWAQKQPHLPNVSELELMLFLHSCYFSIEQAKTTMDNFYTFRTYSPEFFSNCGPTSPLLQQTMDIYLFVDLPKRTPDGYEILISKLIDANASRFLLKEQVKLFDMSTMQMLYEKGPAEGFVIVVDFAGYTMSHLLKMHVMEIKKILMYMQEALPTRLKALYFINVGSVMDRLMALLKPFIKQSLADSFLYYGTDFEELFKHVPKECLPQDYGGQADSIKVLHENLKKRLVNNRSFFEELEKKVADESKRPGKPKNAGDIFGVEGSFKKLDID